jgi:hypothetical protein
MDYPIWAILLKAVNDTINFFGWNFQTLIFGFIYLLGLLFHYLKYGKVEAMNEVKNKISFILKPLGLLTILVFIYNFAVAPYKLSIEKFNQDKASLQSTIDDYKKDTSKDDEIKRLKSEVEKLNENQTNFKIAENKIYTFIWTNVAGKNQPPDKDIPIDIRNVGNISIEGGLISNTQLNRKIQIEVLTSAIKNGTYIQYHSQDLNSDGTFNFGLTQKPGFMKLRLHVNDGQKVNCKGIVSVTYY